MIHNDFYFFPRWGVGGVLARVFKFKTVKSICNFKIMLNGKLIGDA